MEYGDGTMTIAQLRELQRPGIVDADKCALVDIRTVRIDQDEPIDMRVRHFLSQIRNPYAFRAGDTAVGIMHLPVTRTLEDAMASYLRSLIG